MLFLGAHSQCLQRGVATWPTIRGPRTPRSRWATRRPRSRPRTSRRRLRCSPTRTSRSSRCLCVHSTSRIGYSSLPYEYNNSWLTSAGENGIELFRCDFMQAISASTIGIGNMGGGGADSAYGYGGPSHNGLGGGADEEDVAFSKLSVRDRLRTFNAPPSARMYCTHYNLFVNKFVK